jgi:hypothetical protein
MTVHGLRKLGLAFTSMLVVVGLSLPGSAGATAVTRAPGWEITTTTYPTNLAPGSSGLVEMVLYNTGSEASSGTVTVTDTLPAGMVATEAGEIRSQKPITKEEWECAGTTVVTCTNSATALARIPVGHTERLGIAVNVSAGASGIASNQIVAAGGGAPSPASTTGQISLSSAPARFGFANFDGWFSNADGTTDTQAGSHPYEATISYTFNTVIDESVPTAGAGGENRNIDVRLPPGLVGDTNAVPQCTRQALDGNKCPEASQVGVDTFAGSSELHPLEATRIVYNMVPPPGVAAEFAFSVQGIDTFIDAVVRSQSDYGVTERVTNVPQRGIVGNTITIWGTPSDPSHDEQRGNCILYDVEQEEREGVEPIKCPSGAPGGAFLTLPTSCDSAPSISTVGDIWEKAGVIAEASALLHENSGTPSGFTGCDHLSFNPTISVAPDTSEADTPAGLTVELKVPQEGLSNIEDLATSNIKNTTVVLPEGVVINPGQAAGLKACGASEDAVGTEGAPSCPLGSKVGTVEIETPLLRDKLSGSVYVLQSNPPNLKLLVAASGDGVNLKLVGVVHLDGATGRLTTTFDETPELPFTDFKLSFSGGAQAALVTPTRCGSYATQSDFVPWGSPFVSDAFPTSRFVVDSGPGSSACVSSLPFSPSMIAGSTTDQAAGYTSFSLLLQRGDGQQRISKLQFKTPEGLLGMISKVPLCQEPQAAQGTCGSDSQIGHTVVEAGPGPYPLVVPQPGQPPAPIYLTGPYEGAPYGLSIVVPLVVGPFTLQTQVVRGRIEVDPHTARLTVTTDPLPTIIDGIPADLRAINAVIDRPGFMFNPTNCSPQSFSGTATSTGGASAQLESHFQMGSCQSLSFKPNFKVSTAGRTSRKSGASLSVKLQYPNVPPGNNQASSQSNIQSVKVDLPKQLPSRLTTLQKACTSATFEANPANCPSASLVGHATAITPVLPVPLNGPAYFVSHGGEAFPSLVVVLQGYGVTVDLVGSTFIDSKTNITSSTFRQVPDVPITSFALTLPQGPFSALAANGNLCKTKLRMPTAFTAQDGAVIHQSTPIAVTGCAKAKKKASRAGGKQTSKKGKRKRK